MKAPATFTAMILACFVFQASLFSQTPDTNVDQVMANMEKAGRNFPMLQADVRKTLYSSALNKTKGDPQSGKVWIATPANAARRIKIDFDKPLRELFLVDKGILLHYYPGEKTGDRKPVSRGDQEEGECVLMGLCQASPRIKQYYEIKVVGPETIDGIKTTRVALKPKDPKHASGFALIELWLDSTKWYTIQTRITETNNNYANYRFSNFQTAKFSDSVFKIDIDKKAEISDHK